MSRERVIPRRQNNCLDENTGDDVCVYVQRRDMLSPIKRLNDDDDESNE